MAVSSKAFQDKRDPSWPKGLYRRQHSYRFKRRLDGRSYLDVWGEMAHVDAMNRAIRYNLELAEGKDPVREREVKETTFREFAYAHWLKKKSAELRPKSFARYRAVIDNFTYYLEEIRKLKELPVGSVDYALTIDYFTHRGTEPLMPNGSRKFTRSLRGGASKKTLYTERTILGQLFREAIKRGLMSVNPIDEVQAARPKRQDVVEKHHPLGEREVAALLKSCLAVDEQRWRSGNARFRDVVYFMLHTGMRESEVRNLEWSDIDWTRHVVKLRAKRVTERRLIPLSEQALAQFRKLIADRLPDESVFRSESALDGLHTRLQVRDKRDLLALKTRDVDLDGKRLTTERTYTWKPKAMQGEVPMSQGVLTLLTDLHRESESNFVFAHHDGGSCRLRLLDMLKQAKAIAEIPGNLRIHDLRHTFAVRLRERGVPLETIMGILRHADIRETLIYAPYQIAEGKRAVDLLDQRPPAALE